METLASRIYNGIRTLVYVAFAIAVIVCAQTFAMRLQYLVGAVMVFYGVEETAYILFNSEKKFHLRSAYWNAFEILIGITLLALSGSAGVEVSYVVVCVCWATWSILRETKELYEATVEFKHKISAIPNILESLIVVGFSIALIVSPTEHHAKMHLYLLAVELVTKVLFPLIDAFYGVFKHKKDATIIVCDENVVKDESPLADANSENDIEMIASDCIKDVEDK